MSTIAETDAALEAAVEALRLDQRPKTAESQWVLEPLVKWARDGHVANAIRARSLCLYSHNGRNAATDLDTALVDACFYAMQLRIENKDHSPLSVPLIEVLMSLMGSSVYDLVDLAT